MTEHRALRYVNEKLVSHGLEPLDRLPKGSKRSHLACPVARGLRNSGINAAVFGNELAVDATYETLPLDVQAFIARFDRGEIPELDAARCYPPMPVLVEPAEFELQAA